MTIIEIVKQNMENADVTLDLSKEAFSASLGQAPRAINVKRFEELNQNDFIDALWLSCFGRLPGADKKAELMQKTREEVLRSAASEPGFSVKRLAYANCKYENTEPAGMVKAKNAAFTVAGAAKNSIALRKFAKSLPAPLQNGIRRIFS